MTKIDELTPQVVAVRASLKDPNSIRVTFQLDEPLNRFDYQAYRNLKAELKAAAREGEPRDERRFKLKKKGTKFTTLAQYNDVTDHVHRIDAHFNAIAFAGRQLRALCEGREQEAVRELKEQGLLKE